MKLANQPKPNQRKGPRQVDVTPLVQADLAERSRKGIQTYGVPLRTHNGRNALCDAYEEALDMACYLRQALSEFVDMQQEIYRLRADVKQLERQSKKGKAKK